MPHDRAVILSIGDELVLGQSLDTNSRWLSERLLAEGITVLRHATVADDLDSIADELLRAAAEAQVVVTTGGLGPTLDDLTRAALGRALGQPLVEDAAALEQIRAWYGARSRTMPERNRVQALRPATATCIENPNGTAPGLAASLAGADTFCLPGPPREMRPMFERHVLPALRPARAVRTRLIRTFGLGESRVAELLGDLMDRGRMPLVGTTASAGVVTVRIRWEGAPGEPASASSGPMRETDRLIRQALGHAVITPEGEDGESGLAEIVIDLLRSRGRRLAIAESCTGGRLGSLITDVPGCAAAFTGGWITYTNAMKASQLGVPETFFPEVRAGAPGAVSSEVAQAMALGALQRARHDIADARGPDDALAITGIAGPDGGTDAKPVGTVWICHASREGRLDCRRFLFGGDRESVRRWSAATALGMLRLSLVGADLELQGELERRTVE